MKNARPYPCATITPKGERALTSGHPWVYDAEVTELVPAPGETEVKNGSIVDVVSRKGSYLGSGTLFTIQQDPHPSYHPQRQRPLRRRVLDAQSALGLGSPQGNHGRRPLPLPRHLFGGR